MDLPKLQALIAPLATPVAPALLLGNEMYQVMKTVDINWLLALLAATVAIVGLESSGALASYMAVKAWARGDWLAMIIAMGGAGLYALIVMGGIALMPQQRAQVFGVMVLVTLVAYLGYALYHSYTEQDQQKQVAAGNKLELLKERRLLTNAQTRQIKAGGQVSSVKFDSLTPKVDKITTSGQRVIDYLNEHGDGKSLREIAQIIEVSHQTVATWRDYWRENK